MRAAVHNPRPKGAGTICRARECALGPAKWIAKTPRVNGKRANLGRFDTYREAERALAAFAEQKKAG